MHMTPSYVTSKLMEGCSRNGSKNNVLQSYIARLVYMHGSLMALNGTLAWEVQHASCLMKISRLVEVIPSHGLKNTTFRGNVIHGKKYFHKGTQLSTCEIQRDATSVHTCKNEAVIKWYCMLGRYNVRLCGSFC